MDQDENILYELEMTELDVEIKSRISSYIRNNVQLNREGMRMTI